MKFHYTVTLQWEGGHLSSRSGTVDVPPGASRGQVVAAAVEKAAAAMGAPPRAVIIFHDVQPDEI